MTNGTSNSTQDLLNLKPKLFHQIKNDTIYCVLKEGLSVSRTIFRHKNVFDPNENPSLVMSQCCKGCHL